MSIRANRAGVSGLYVDVENLQSHGQAVIQSLVEHWPDKAPAPSRLTLYVRANQVELWRLWAASRFSDLEVVVKGTQHFSMTSTKNSADIAIATNAMADLIAGRVAHVALLSDDSDFISLYGAVRDEPEIPLSDGKVPFLWIVTDREDRCQRQSNSSSRMTSYMWSRLSVLTPNPSWLRSRPNPIGVKWRRRLWRTSQSAHSRVRTVTL